MAHSVSVSVQRKGAGPASQNLIRSSVAASRRPARAFSSRSSASVATRSGGGGGRSWLPDARSHVFQVPARGSTGPPAGAWARTAPGAAAAKNAAAPAAAPTREAVHRVRRSGTPRVPLRVSLPFMEDPPSLCSCL